MSGRRIIGQELLPLTPTISFLSECYAIDEGIRGSKNKLTRLKNFLIAKHLEVFGSSPAEKTPLNVIKARVSYRLQYESMRIAGKEMGEKFLQNYQAVMKFNDEKPFEGCDKTTGWIATRLMLEEGRTVSLTSIKKIETKTNSNLEKTGTTSQSRELVFGKYRPTEIVRWYATIGARCNQVEKALNILGIVLAIPTIRGNLGKGGRNDGVPKLEKTEETKLREVLPDDSLKPRKKRNGLADPDPENEIKQEKVPVARDPEPVVIKKLVRIRN